MKKPNRAQRRAASKGEINKEQIVKMVRNQVYLDLAMQVEKGEGPKYMALEIKNTMGDESIFLYVANKALIDEINTTGEIKEES